MDFREHWRISPEDESLEAIESKELDDSMLLFQNGTGLNGRAMRGEFVVPELMLVMVIVTEPRPLHDIDLRLEDPL